MFYTAFSFFFTFSACNNLLNLDWLSVPLPYSQVATLATYGFFSICLIGRQLLDGAQDIKGFEVDHYFPIFTVLQFMFYIGWLEVGQDLMRPFGQDDDDFEFNVSETFGFFKTFLEIPYSLHH